ncbi:MAG: helix-turn-helix transcriptional regulator [Clostridia bacterium]|nr:helix-turn-helix transcriptional regulator [Clostridia bacterium]
MNTTLGQRIAALRREMSLKQAELAEQLGVSPQAVSKWENEISHS